MGLGIFREAVRGAHEGMVRLLSEAGLSGHEVSDWMRLEPGQRTAKLIGRYNSDLSGRSLASLLRAINRLGEPEAVADYFIEIIQGPPVAGQLMVLRMVEDSPELGGIPALRRAVRTYQADFDSPVAAFTWYQDRYLGGCEKRACNTRPLSDQ